MSFFSVSMDRYSLIVGIKRGVTLILLLFLVCMDMSATKNYLHKVNKIQIKQLYHCYQFLELLLH